jgi:hypothetical protein
VASRQTPTIGCAPIRKLVLFLTGKRKRQPEVSGGKESGRGQRTRTVGQVRLSEAVDAGVGVRGFHALKSLEHARLHVVPRHEAVKASTPPVATTAPRSLARGRRRGCKASKDESVDMEGGTGGGDPGVCVLRWVGGRLRAPSTPFIQWHAQRCSSLSLVDECEEGKTPANATRRGRCRCAPRAGAAAPASTLYVVVGNRG